MKVRAIAPNVVKYAAKERWYEKLPFFNSMKWRLRSIGSTIRGSLRRHHIIKIRSLDRGTWYDTDTRMFEANFQLLVDYVEQKSLIV